MTVYEAIMKRRTIRKYKQTKIQPEIFKKIVNSARVCASAANMQPLKYIIVSSDEMCKEIFPCLKWAAYFKDGSGEPKEGEEPTAYVIILGDKNIKASFDTDAGAAITNMMLTAYEEGLGSCWFASVDREKVRNILNIDDNLDVLYVLSLGYPSEESSECEMKDNDVKYFRNDDGSISVPKRSMDEVLIDIR